MRGHEGGTACGGRGLKGRARVTGERPIGAAKANNLILRPCANPPPPPGPGVAEPNPEVCPKGGGRDALEGKGSRRRPQKRLDRRLEEVATAVGGGYCQLQMPLKPALGVRGTVAGHRLGALEEGGASPSSNASLGKGQSLPERAGGKLLHQTHPKEAGP